MAVELWIGQKFERMKEQEALDRFLADMNDKFGESDELYLILANYSIGINQIDLTVLKRNAIIVIELKECAEPFKARQNGDWVILTPDKHIIGTGDKNPYEQVHNYRRLWIDYLTANHRRFLPTNKGQNMEFTHVSAFVAISPSIHPNSDIDFPYILSYWFRLVGLDQLSNAVYKQTSPKLNFSDTELRKIAKNELNLRLASIPSNIRHSMINSENFIKEKTRHFVGRRFVFEAIEQFLQGVPRGYFFVRGDPGIGKSSLAAELVKQLGYVHHFNIRAEGINKADKFIKNVCAQLIARYNLSYTSLPPEATKDANFLNNVLGQISQKLNSGEKCLIVVDALDEVDTVEHSEGVNPLCLPVSLPQGVYMLVTMRKDTKMVRVECEQKEFFIDPESESNQNDICEYLQQTVKKPGIQKYITKQEIDDELFIEYLQKKSEGNFMYLRYVLPEIEKGAYQDLDLADLPLGLQNYYEEHWKRIRGADEDAWFGYKLPIVMALTVVQEPVSIEQIVKFSNVKQQARVRAVLEEWGQFLHKENDRYRIYHATFHDFIAHKEEVKDERVSRQLAHEKIIDALGGELLDNE